MKHNHEVVTVFVSYMGSVSRETLLGGWYTDSTKKHAITTSLHILSSIIIYSQLVTEHYIYSV